LVLRERYVRSYLCFMATSTMHCAEELGHYDIPSLDYPFPARMNGWVEEAHTHTLDWVSRFGLIAERSLPRFERCRFARLAARAYPSAGREELKIVADWNIWLFIHDDQNDEMGFGRRPELLRGLHDRLRAILAGATPGAGDDAFAHSLHELAGRMFAGAADEWRIRFLESVDEYFVACAWEAENRRDRRVPSVASYIDKRPLTGALNTDIVLIERCEQVFLPQYVYEHPMVRALTLASNNVVCWSNDILSLPKEHRAGDVHNLVIALAHERRLGWQEAVDRAAAMHDAQVETFLALERGLPTFGDDIDAELGRYVAVLRAWMRGNLDWARETGRYGQAAPRPTHVRVRGTDANGDEAVGWR
jgi:terpene synthase-like protein